ncbi:hypothetical protein BDQ17DRAFT_983986 [Cyathus striatus]|nr:hypothetical protein BDQ17DRAFT_983986 [Cyathus striatus]
MLLMKEFRKTSKKSQDDKKFIKARSQGLKCSVGWKFHICLAEWDLRMWRIHVYLRNALRRRWVEETHVAFEMRHSKSERDFELLCN